MSKKLLRKKLALMLATLKKKRKYYCEVEYLESTGTQWINAGINVNTSTDEIKLYFELTETQNYKWFFGEYDNNARLGLGSGDGANKRNFLYQQSATKVSDTQMCNTQHLFEINSNGGFLDGTKIRDYLSFASTSHIYLFNLNIDSPSDYRCKSKIWRYEHKRNGVLIRDMIPVIDWDMTPCMYDRVTEQLFYNEETSDNDFSYGREIHPVDYLESTGVEYIDTGIKFDGSNTKIELKTYEDSITRTHSICGDNGNFFYYFRGTGNWAVGYNGTAANIDTYMSVGDNVFVMDKNNVYVNGVLAKTYTASSAVSSYNTLLFNRKTSLVDNGAVTMHYCKMWNNNVLVRDYIPAIDENGVGFMFDRVSHTCFLNQGTGAFNYPPVELEYIECVVSNTNKPYIDTGVYATENTRVLAKLYTTDTSNRNYFGGSVNGASSTADGFVFNAMSTTKLEYLFGKGSGWKLADATNIVGVPFELDFSKSGVILDGSVIDVPTYTSFPSQTLTVTLFVRNGGSAFINGRVYYFKMYENGTLVRDFIPCYKDGVSCMVDKLTGTVYLNQGTGTFTTGKIVEPEYE